ncbi:hypothetical protein MMC09_003863 [Bachmanniomyces sp. S44760]|nr:hypothetical protein [Bachmanniomyces sp. S44760]
MPVSDIETSFSSFQNESRDINEDNDHHSDTKLLGKTLDLTLLSTTRGLDAAIRCFRSPFAKANAQPNVPCRHGTSLSRLADSAIFVVSAGTVMWSWFYHPDRLPKAYNEWIGEAAHVDARLVETLRQARRGDFVYAKSRDKNTLLVEMCKEYGWPLQWGDPSKTVPIPCEMVHMGVGPSCHWHAVTRFIRSFQFALATYLPLQLVVKARNPSMKAVQAALKEAIRSSAFLGTFISLFYYSVCLARTLLGPKIFSRDFVSPIMWDKGLCVGVGCVICGWSILIETENRKQEMAFFVAPRAAATFLPRLYNERYFYLEQLAFSTSTAILFALAEDKPEKVRGVLGQLLHRVLDTA